MNYVDKNFAWFQEEMQRQTKEEVFLHCKQTYLFLPESIQDGIEQFLNQFGYWGQLDHRKGIWEELENRVDSIYDHQTEYAWLYQKLGDYRSKKLLFAILNNWYQFDFMTIKEMMDPTYTHYFDLDLVTCHQEIFVDVGAYIGDTTLDFIHSYGLDGYRKIYCYEMTEDTISHLKTNLKDYPNIEVRNKAVSNKVDTFYVDTKSGEASANVLRDTGEISIEALTLDEDIQEPISLIKMDIEGSEQAAILGCQKHIQKDHPTLLISVYHNHEDLWKIPRMIEEIDTNYTFYLRFYGSELFPTEIVLFAIYQG